MSALLAAAAVWVGTAVCAADAEPPVYLSLDGMEPDKCASIWLIRRHIAVNARFAFFAPGDEPPEGILFDTPRAEFRRRHNRSTFEDLVAAFGIDDERVGYIARVIHDIEINTWQRKALAETPAIAESLHREIGGVASADSVDDCIRFFDRLTVP